MIRRALFQIHWFLGITAGLVLALMGVTGATMSFEDEIMAALSPGIVTVASSNAQPLSPDALIAAVSQQRPDLRVRQLVIHSDPGLAAEVSFLPAKGVRRGEHQYVDPRSGVLLGAAKGEAFFNTVMELHRWLALPGAGNGWGRQITGFAAFSLIFFALSGLYLRWPRRALDWRSWFVLDLRKTGRNLYRALHATIGTWIALLYLLSAMTGLTWSYSWYRQGAVYVLTGKSGGAGGRERETAKDAPPVTLAPAWAQMLKTDGTRYEKVSISLPQGEGPIAMRVLPKGARFDRMTDELRFDAATGALVKADRYATRSTGAVLAGNFYPLHTGAFFGMIGRILLMLSSITMPLFTVTGLLLYFARRRAKRALLAVAAADTPLIDAGGSDMLVIHASQTGNAERIARMSASAFPGAAVRALGSLDPEELRRASRALFVIATYGQGDAPDRARGFESRTMAAPLDLGQLDYAVIALGDHEYADFCAFGHRVDAWLHAGGAKRLFDLVEMDGDDADAERHWQQQLAAISGHAIEPDWRPAAYAPWTLAGREHVNPGSAGEPVYRITLQPEQPASWAPGAIAEVMPRHDPARLERWLGAVDRGEDAELRGALVDKVLPESLPADLAALKPLSHRDYSIASIDASGQVELLVRLARAEDGGAGIGSGYLCTVAGIGDAVSMRVRDNPGFAAPEDNKVPLVLIGNGTGIAGLMGHLRERAQAGGAPVWLLFGERSRAHDRPFRDELDGLEQAGTLARLDLAFSRDPDCGRYVQHLVAEAADEVQAWADRGAAFYVCGSLAGMASGVDAALREVLGDARVEAMLTDGLYRRDIY